MIPSSRIRSALPTAASVALLLLSADTLAETGAAEVPGVSSSTMLQTLLGLVLILALLFAIAFFLRRMGGGHGFGKNGPLRIVGGLMTGTRERIVLLEIGETWLVIGVTPGQMRTLHTMPKGELPEATGPDKAFGKLLRQMIDGKHEAR